MDDFYKQPQIPAEDDKQEAGQTGELSYVPVEPKPAAPRAVDAA